MANPAAVEQRPHVPAAMLRRQRRANRRLRLRVRAQVIANAAVFLLSTAGSIVIYYGAANPSDGSRRTGPGGDEPAYVLLAFLFSLIGIWLVRLALVADRFPAAATLGEAIAMALRGYFFGGGRRN